MRGSGGARSKACWGRCKGLWREAYDREPRPGTAGGLRPREQEVLGVGRLAGDLEEVGGEV